VHIELLAKTVHDQGGEYAFYDRNATTPYSQGYNDPTLLKSVVDWDLLTEAPQLDGFCQYFQDRHEPAKYMDRMEKRQAEFLVKNCGPITWFTRIGVIDETKAKEVRALVVKYGVNLAVEVKTDWYFLGQ
jgi:hypothetical protein